MSVFARPICKIVDNKSGKTQWYVKEPKKPLVEATEKNAAYEMCDLINLKIMEKLPVKIGGYKA